MVSGMSNILAGILRLFEIYWRQDLSKAKVEMFSGVRIGARSSEGASWYMVRVYVVFIL